MGLQSRLQIPTLNVDNLIGTLCPTSKLTSQTKIEQNLIKNCQISSLIRPQNFLKSLSRIKLMGKQMRNL